MKTLFLIAIQMMFVCGLCATVQPGDKYTVDGSGSVCVPFGDDEEQMTLNKPHEKQIEGLMLWNG